MRAEVERRLGDLAEKVVDIFALICVLACLWFAVVLAQRGVYALLGWNYHFQSIGDYLHLHEPHKKIESWDRSFLLVGIAFLAGGIAGGFSDAATWLRKTPEERRRERDIRKAAERAVNEEKSRKVAERRAARKPMSGWRRLWIVASLLFGALTYLVAYDNYRRASALMDFNGDSEAFWMAAHHNRELGNCIWATAKADHWTGTTYMISCQNADPWLFASLWAFLPAIILAVVGITVRWVYRGFRPKTAS